MTTETIIRHEHTINLNVKLENVHPAVEWFIREGEEIKIDLQKEALGMAYRAAQDPEFRAFLMSALGIA
jgi:hypothetical protein